jgi:hypothetical protein
MTDMMSAELVNSMLCAKRFGGNPGSAAAAAGSYLEASRLKIHVALQ